MAASLAAFHRGIKVAHVEAGMRSRDMRMPEEINRLCTDAVSDILFTTDEGAGENLRAEGAIGEVVFVGNTMADTLLRHRERAAQLDLRERWGLEEGGYGLVGGEVLDSHGWGGWRNRTDLVLEALFPVVSRYP